MVVIWISFVQCLRVSILFLLLISVLSGVDSLFFFFFFLQPLTFRLLSRLELPLKGLLRSGVRLRHQLTPPFPFPFLSPFSCPFLPTFHFHLHSACPPFRLPYIQSPLIRSRILP